MVLNLKSFLKKLLLLVVAILCIAKLSSCGEESSGEQSKITKKLKLSAEYTGKDFYTQGIGQATLVRTSDGDTAAFTLVESNKYVTIRFFGIDTPESTGQVQKWGKAASIFTKDKLENAYEIVLEASTTPASVDSYGTRYLAYVWYKPTEDSDFLNLNLQLVENGYTKNNCINTSEYKYYEHFNNAEKAAKKNKLRIWNDDAEDPYFSTEAIITNIKDILENEETYYNAESDSGSKVRIEAYVVGFYKSNSGTTTYTVAQIIEGKQYTMNVYAGYASSGISSFVKVGNSYSFTGSIQKYSGALQISGLTYVPMKEGGDYLTQLKKNVYCTFDSSIEQSSIYGTALHSDATIISAELDGTNIKFEVTATNSKSEESVEFTFIVPNTNNLNSTSVSALVGKTVTTVGIQSEIGVISIYQYSDISFK